MNMLIKRAAIYVRVSTKEQEEEGTSLETQEERSLIYCKEHNYKVNPNLLFRETKSAKDYINRDELAKLREAARRGEFDILVVYVYDRLSRKMVHQAVIIDDLERHGIRVESVTEPFDNSTVGIFLRNARAFAAELELEKIKERTMRGILKKVTNGQLIGGGKPKYGFKWNEDRTGYLLSDTLVAVDSTGKGWEQVQAVCDNDAILEADETGTQWTEIRLVCYIFYLYVIEDLTMRAIGQKLMEEGKHPSSAEAWSISVLSRMLEDEAYIGNAYQYMSQIVQEPGQKPRQVARPLKEQIKLPDGVIPKVIRREIFEAAQRKSQENKQYAERNNPNVEDGILRCGFIRCGYCNGSMTVKRRDTVKSEQGRIARYVCQSGSSVISNCKAPTISTQVLDTIVWEKVTERTKLLAKMPHLIDEAIERHLQRDPKKVELPSVTNQIAKLNRTIRSLVSMANQDIDEDIQEEINSQLVYYSQQKIKLLELKDQIEEQHVAWEKIADVLREFKAWCLESAGDIEHASYKQKRIALNALGVRVKVWSVDHEPRYYIEMSPPTILKAVSPTAATLSERKSLKKGSIVFQSSRVGGSLD